MLNERSYPADTTQWTDEDYEAWADEYLNFCRLHDVDTHGANLPWDPTPKVVTVDDGPYCECNEDCTPHNCGCGCHFAHLEVSVEYLF